MAVLATVDSSFGGRKKLYIRINNLTANNHQQPCSVLLRGYASQQAFIDKAPFEFEQSLNFNADVTLCLWQQAYDAFKQQVEIQDAEDII